jgi:hypothetical protein
MIVPKYFAFKFTNQVLFFVFGDEIEQALFFFLILPSSGSDGL